jgi:hypothetical protein
MSVEPDEAAEDLSHPEYLCFPSLPQSYGTETVIDLLSWLFLDEELLQIRCEFLNQLRSKARQIGLPQNYSSAGADDFQVELDALKKYGVRQAIERGEVAIERLCLLAQEPDVLQAASDAILLTPEHLNAGEVCPPAPVSGRGNWVEVSRQSTHQNAVAAAADRIKTPASAVDTSATHTSRIPSEWYALKHNSGLAGIRCPEFCGRTVDLRILRVNDLLEWEFMDQYSQQVSLSSDGLGTFRIPDDADIKVEISGNE